VSRGIVAIHQRLPFPLRDNSCEFINHCLLGWRRYHDLRFTRGPNRENDQDWVEQCNGVLVRRLGGPLQLSGGPDGPATPVRPASAPVAPKRLLWKFRAGRRAPTKLLEYSD